MVRFIHGIPTCSQSSLHIDDRPAVYVVKHLQITYKYRPMCGHFNNCVTLGGRGEEELIHNYHQQIVP